MRKTDGKRVMAAVSLAIAIVAAVATYIWADNRRDKLSSDDRGEELSEMLPTRDVPTTTPATGGGNGVPVESDFGTSVVYTTDMGANTTPLRNDCEARGGTFNECGSVCEPGSEMCVAVCAYTCDNIR